MYAKTHLREQHAIRGGQPKRDLSECLLPTIFCEPRLIRYFRHLSRYSKQLAYSFGVCAGETDEKKATMSMIPKTSMRTLSFLG